MGSRTVVLFRSSIVSPAQKERWWWDVIPVRTIKCFDGLRIQVLDSLLVATAHSILGTRIAVESIDGFGNTHLGGSHG